MTLLLCACNNNKEPDLEIEFPISVAFDPASIEINKDEIDEQERAEIMYLVNNKHVVNDISELPSDPIGQDDAFYRIDYQANTLLIMYIYHWWVIDTYTNRFYRNTSDNSYNWVVRLGITPDDDNTAETVRLTRFAVVVRKLPSEAKIETWSSLTEL